MNGNCYEGTVRKTIERLLEAFHGAVEDDVFPTNKLNLRAAARFIEDEDIKEMVPELANYVLWMLRKIPRIEDPEKRSRWLGFVNGMCCVLGLFDIRQMQDMIREDAERTYGVTSS